MYNSLIHRIVILSGFLVALLCFIYNMHKGGDLFYSAFVSLCVLFLASTVFLVALQAIAKVLFKHLAEQKRAQLKQMKEGQEKKETEK